MNDIVDLSRRFGRKAQSGISKHPRHPTGFDLKTGLPNACISPSCSFYADLCKYGELKWAA